MYWLCYSETLNVCFLPFRRQTLQWNGAAAISFVGCLVFNFRYSVVGSAMRVEYSIAYRTLVRQPFLNIALENGTPKTVLTVKKITAATVSDSRRIG